jgi:hypothetical protein
MRTQPVYTVQAVGDFEAQTGTNLEQAKHLTREYLASFGGHGLARCLSYKDGEFIGSLGIRY